MDSFSKVVASMGDGCGSQGKNIKRKEKVADKRVLRIAYTTVNSHDMENELAEVTEEWSDR